MATASAAAAAARARKSAVKEAIYFWEGKDRSGKLVKGEMRASGMNVVNATLRRQGVNPTKV
jgi:type IV pilus assembly protein PilC